MKLRRSIFLAAIALCFAQTNADVIVTTNQDNPSGPIVGQTTLRDAINTINGGSGGEIIAFAPNVSTIHLLEPLPTITEQVIIDGLATIDNSTVQPGSCDNIPSPIDQPEAFLHSLRVVIDGKNIPQSNSASQSGLFFEASSLTSIVRGIRVQNIFGTPGSPAAYGIQAESNTQGTTVECCIIDTIFAANNSVIATESVGLQSVTIVSKSYIRNIHSASSNLALTSLVTTTGPTYGITDSQLLTDTRVECIESGSVLGSKSVAGSSSNFLIGEAAGIHLSSSLQKKAPNTKQCFTDDGGSEERIYINNCVVQHVKGGSVLLENCPEQVILDIVSGVYLDTNIETTIENCIICDIQTGSATLSCNDQGSTDVNLTTEGLFGIFASNSSNGTCIHNNAITSIVHSNSHVNAENSDSKINSPIGIFGSASPIVIENNKISSLFGGSHTTAGKCSTLRAQQFNDANLPIGATGIVTNREVLRKNTRKDIDCLLPISTSDPLTVICNNTVTSIAGGKLAASGEASSILGHGSCGIAASSEEPIIVNNNAVEQVSGVSLFTTQATARSYLSFGSKGIVTRSDDTQICYNAVSLVEEGKVSTVFNSVHINFKQAILTAILANEVMIAVDSPVHTAGISSLFLTNQNTSIIENNIVKDILSSQPFGAGIALAGIAIGITVDSETSNMPDPNLKSKTIAKQCGSNRIESSIANNSVSAITSDKTTPAYGIFASSLTESQELVIESNNITHVNGGGAALSQTISNAAPLVESFFCSGGTHAIEVLTLVPSFLPYEPTSGIYLLENNCTIAFNNIIKKIHAPQNQARGITLTASQDVGILENSISQVQGAGIFIGGAPVPVGSSSIFDIVLPSIRNIIHSNKTFDNTKKGIELGVSDWSNFYQLSELASGSETIETIVIIGNHNQVAPKITNVVCNSNGTISIEALLVDPRHPNSDFIIQFFKNSSNGIPHGETPISDFDGSEFILTTTPYGSNGFGVAQKTFTFIPLDSINKGDTITAHVTLLTDGSEDIGDTSEFGVETTKIRDYSSLYGPKPHSFCFSNILSRP